MQQIIDFLRQLQANNTREWFTAHKSQYQDCKAAFDEFTERLVAGLREMDDSIGPLQAKDCTYRIYRDTRFSADKTPYKTHFGAFVVPGGKKSGFAGYYLQIGAVDKGYPGGCMLATGDYCCQPAVLQTLREDIAADPDLFVGTLDQAAGFTLDRENDLKRVPAGFPADQPWSQYLRLRNFCLLKEPGQAFMLQPNLAERAVEEFSRTKPFLRFINRAVEYVHETEA